LGRQVYVGALGKLLPGGQDENAPGAPERLQQLMNEAVCITVPPFTNCILVHTVHFF
jgi:hypothetical protein